MHGPSLRAVAVARARNISGGVNPPALLVCYCPVRRNRSGSRGPLSRLLGGHFHQLDSALQRAWKQPDIHHSEYDIVESHSFLERVLTHVAWQYFRTGQDRVGGGKEYHLLSTKPRTYSSRPNTLLQEHCAFYYATEVVIFTDEPALVAEPGWLLYSRLTR